MEIVNYISSSAIPITILIVLIFGLYEKKNVFDSFLEGAKEGISIVIKIFPTLIGLFVAIGCLRTSGILDAIISFCSPVTKLLKIPSEIMPLAFLRPISGSGSMAIATEIMSKYGVDSQIGLIASTIMGATETTIYTIAIYTSAVGIKKTRFVLLASLIGDVVRNSSGNTYLANFVVRFFLTKYNIQSMIKANIKKA